MRETFYFPVLCFLTMYVSQTIKLYTLNLHNDVCWLYFYKTGTFLKLKIILKKRERERERKTNEWEQGGSTCVKLNETVLGLKFLVILYIVSHKRWAPIFLFPFYFNIAHWNQGYFKKIIQSITHRHTTLTCLKYDWGDKIRILEVITKLDIKCTSNEGFR